MKLVVFTGKMGSGKSTAVQHIKNCNLDKKVVVIKFADPIYQMQEFCYRRISTVYQRPESFTKDRKLLQFLGTDWARAIDPNIWTTLWEREVKYAQENYPNAILVCDDCRFENEAQAVLSLGGSIIKLTSNKAAARIDTKAGINNHSSEAGIDDKYVAFSIDNSHTIEEFHNALDVVLKKLL